MFRDKHALLALPRSIMNNEVMALSHVTSAFATIEKEDNHLMGETAVQLAELSRKHIPILPGFVIPTTAWNRFLRERGLKTKLTHLIATINFSDPNSLMLTAAHLRRLIKQTALDDELAAELIHAYRQLGGVLNDPTVILRPSPVLPNHTSPSHSALDVIMTKGEASFLEGIKTIWATEFEAKRLLLRQQQQHDHFTGGMGIIVQTYHHPDVSGYIMSEPQASAAIPTLTIHAVYGSITHGKEHHNADIYHLTKKEGGIMKKELHEQTEMYQLDMHELHTVHVAEKLRRSQKLSDSHMQELAEYAKKIEDIYYFPQRISWILSHNFLFILETKMADDPGSVSPDNIPSPLITGTALPSPVVSGSVTVVDDEKKSPRIASGDIVVTESLPNALIPKLKPAAGVIIEKHETRARSVDLIEKLRIPLIFGAKGARKQLRHERFITIHGSTGSIYRGRPSIATYGMRHTGSLKYPRTATAFSVLLNDRITADTVKTLGADAGILDGGLLIRQLGVHPKKIINDHKTAEYRDTLATKIAEYTRFFYPRPVIFSLADLESTVLRALTGGKQFEAFEENPALGYRGAHRYIHDQLLLSLQADAILHVREKLRLTTLWLTLTFCRTPREMFHLKKLLTERRLTRSATFKIGASLQVPANIMQLDEFLGVGIDSITIDADSLGMYFLGLDKENSDVAAGIDSENDALLQAYHHVITICNKHNIPCTFQTRSHNISSPLVNRLVEWGVTGFALPAGSIENTRKTVYNYERKHIT